MTTAEQLYISAQKLFPGGVNASARANKALGRPFYIAHGDGPYVFDLEGRKYIDMCMSHGASLLGHNHPRIKEAVLEALDLGIICSYETTIHVELAKKINELVPCAEMVRFAGSGTETIMHALRLARTATGRKKILKFEGHFHGYSDEINFSVAPSLGNAGPVDHPNTYPQSSGIPSELAGLVIVVPFNEPDTLEKAFSEHGEDIAALILEPVNYDSGCILPHDGFIQLCRDLCDQYGVLLFFDEVLTAFRMAPGGAQEFYGVIPDLAVLGKAFGGGMPISTIAGTREVMQHLRPVGESEHSGTYLAHLTTVTAALAALEEYSQPGFYENLNKLGAKFYTGFEKIIDSIGIPLKLQHLGPRFGLFFGIKDQVHNYRQAINQDFNKALQFYAACIKRGLYLHVSPHHGFSAAHSEDDIEASLLIIEDTLLDLMNSP